MGHVWCLVCQNKLRSTRIRFSCKNGTSSRYRLPIRITVPHHWIAWPSGWTITRACQQQVFVRTTGCQSILYATARYCHFDIDHCAAHYHVPDRAACRMAVSHLSGPFSMTPSASAGVFPPMTVTLYGMNPVLSTMAPCIVPNPNLVSPPSVLYPCRGHHLSKKNTIVSNEYGSNTSLTSASYSFVLWTESMSSTYDAMISAHKMNGLHSSPL